MPAVDLGRSSDGFRHDPSPDRVGRPTVTGVPTHELVTVVATFVLAAVVVVVIGAALGASVVWLAILIGAGAAFVQYRRFAGPGRGGS